MSDDQTRTQLEDVIKWWPLLDDVADSLLGITGHGVDLAGIHTTSGASATELAVIQLEDIQQISIDLTALAKKMGFRPGLDGTARHYVHANLAWARKNLAPADYEPTITDTHKAIARLTGHAPRPTNRTCPACGEAQLTIIDTGLHCDTCNETRDPDEIEALTTWRLQNANAHVTRKEAALILGEQENTIKQRIRRRQPDYELINGTRHYTIGDLK